MKRKGRDRVELSLIGFIIAATAASGYVALKDIWAPAQDPAQVNGLVCEVSSVTDGDTFRCRDGIRIRLHAIAARETDETCSPGHPCPAATAQSATAALARLIERQTLSCEPIGRSWKRVTAICWTVQGLEVNCEMIRSGTTVVWDRYNRQRPVCRPRS